MKHRSLSGGDERLEGAASRIVDELERGGDKLRRYQRALDELLAAPVEEPGAEHLVELCELVCREESRRGRGGRAHRRAVPGVRAAEGR